VSWRFNVSAGGPVLAGRSSRNMIGHIRMLAAGKKNRKAATGAVSALFPFPGGICGERTVSAAEYSLSPATISAHAIHGFVTSGHGAVGEAGAGEWSVSSGRATTDEWSVAGGSSGFK